MERKKSQIAAEFIILVAMAMIIVTIFISATYKNLDEFSKKRETELLKDTLFKAQNEITIAAKAEDGYKRIFYMPQKLDNSMNYTISVENITVRGTSRNYISFLFIPSINGNISKGNNTLRKTGGILYLNQ